jgi:DNA-binding MarR family transcriptional regulator
MFHTALAAKQGIGPTEEKALDLVQRYGPLTAGELARRSGLAPASVTGLLDRLERRGFARRMRDPRDRRRVLVEVDPSRAPEFELLFADLSRSLDALFARYGDEQLEVILDFLSEATQTQLAATARLTVGENN